MNGVMTPFVETFTRCNRNKTPFFGLIFGVKNVADTTKYALIIRLTLQKQLPILD